MTINYPQVANTAKRLLDAHGRTVTLRRLGRSPTNPDKPWRGSPTPRAAGEVEWEHSIKAVFVEPYSLVRYGFTGTDDEALRRVDVVLISAGKDVTSLGFDPMGVDEVDDRGITYNVTLVRELAPGPVPLMYVWGGKR